MKTSGATWLRVVTYTHETADDAVTYMERSVQDRLHTLEKQPGFQLGYWGRDESAGTIAAVTYWNSRQSMDDAEAALHSLRAEAQAHDLTPVDVRIVRLFAVSSG